MCTKNHNHMKLLRYGARRTEFFYPPPYNPENQNKKKKKASGHVIILHMFAINENNMMYGS